FIAVKLLSNGRSSSNMTINYAGHFKQTQYRSLLESAINIVVSLVCVWKFGIYGVLMGTIAALLYRTNDMILYANRKILGRNPWITYRRWLLNLALFIVVTVAGKWFFSFIALDSYFRIIGWAVVTCIVVIPFFFGVVSLCEREVFRFAMELLKPYLLKVKEKYRKKYEKLQYSTDLRI
ncbi:MAG: polysaccharide biosynthesis C-terminal domain-containing protein, partial [Lachnospiraceae bacterium]|nr:polysaccharide biosynthesis C-terminal domain-containing protein [Lachnospiraceae bacterium]